MERAASEGRVGLVSMRSWMQIWTRLLVVLVVLAGVRTSPAEPKNATPKETAPAERTAAAKPTEAPASEGDKPSESKEKAPPKAAAAAPPVKAKAAPPAAAGKPEARPAASASAAPGAARSGPSGKTESETHILRLRDLESRVDELKEQIRRSHARLSLLSETLLSGGIGGARADLVFKNEMSNAFRIRRILVVLDGAVQYKKQDETDELSNQKEIPVFSGPVPPGDHTLQVVVAMQGHGYGIFSYLKAFKPEVKHTRSFTVEEGKAIRIEITAWEKGSATTPLEQRPALRLTEKIVDRREAELDEAE